MSPTRPTLAAVVVLAGAALAGCTSSPSATPVRPVAPSPSTAPAAIAIAAAWRCTDYEPSTAQLDAAESGTCRLAGRFVAVHTFTDTGQRDRWLAAAKPAQARGGDLWVIAGDRVPATVGDPIR